MAAALCTNLTTWLFTATPASAHGTFYFQHANTLSAIRDSETTATYTGKLEAVENGSFKNDNLGFVDITLLLTKTGSNSKGDRWEITNVNFANTKPSTDNPKAKVSILSPSKLQITNASGESQSYDYANPATSGYGFIVTKGPTKDHAIVLYDHWGTTQEQYHGNGPGTDIDPISGLSRGPDIPIANYDLSTDSGALKNIPVKSEVSDWFDGIGTLSGINGSNGVPITIYEEAGHPPKIFIPANVKASGGAVAKNPALTFKLVSIAGTFTDYTTAGAAIGAVTGFALTAGTFGTLVGAGAGGYIGDHTGSNVAWSIFEAFDENDKAIPPLIILGDNKGPNWEMYYIDESFDASDPSANGSNPLSLQMQDDGDGIRSTTFHQLYRYVFDEPPKPGDDSCKDGRAFTTGPNSPTKILTREYSQVSALNSNCLNRNGSGGWPDYWGVKVTSEAGDAANCGISNIFTGNQDIGGIFGSLTKCLFDSIFKPLVDWAADLVSKAAGISYFRPQKSTFLAAKFGECRRG